MKTTRNNPFRNLKFLAVLLASSLVLWGCDSASPKLDGRSATQSAASTQSGNSGSAASLSAQQFRSVYSDNLTHLEGYLKSHDATLADSVAVRQGVLSFYEERFGVGSEMYERAVDGLESYQFGSTDNLESFPEKVRPVVQRVRNAVDESESQTALQERLSKIHQRVQEKAESEKWNAENRNTALAYVASMQETNSFMKANPGLMEASQNFLGIDWKCALGIAGGAVTGFVTGGWLGALGGALTGGAGACFD